MLQREVSGAVAEGIDGFGDLSGRKIEIGPEPFGDDVRTAFHQEDEHILLMEFIAIAGKILSDFGQGACDELGFETRSFAGEKQRSEQYRVVFDITQKPFDEFDGSGVGARVLHIFDGLLRRFIFDLSQNRRLVCVVKIERCSVQIGAFAEFFDGE